MRARLVLFSLLANAALAEQPKQVEVINVAPVPVVTQGATTVTGTVTIANPQAQVSLAPNSTVALDPAGNTVRIAGPVTVGTAGPLPVTGTVGVSGPVAISGPVQVVGGVSVPGGVSVTNDAAHPIPVQLSAAPAAQTLQFQDGLNMQDGVEGTGELFAYEVPAGKRFLIESINVVTFIPGGQAYSFLDVYVNRRFHAVGVNCVKQGSSNVTVCNQPLHVFADAGSIVSFVVDRTDTRGIADGSFTVTGQLLDAP